MKQQTTQRNTFSKVSDRRGQQIQGLWVRNDAYYVQMRVFDAKSGSRKPIRKRLESTNVPDAVKEMRQLLAARDMGTEPATGRVPTVAALLESWLADYKSKHNSGSNKVRQKSVNLWADKLGTLKIDRVKPSHIRDVCALRIGKGIKPSTVNSDLDTLRMAFKQAVIDGVVPTSPMDRIKPYKAERFKRRLFTGEDVTRFAEAARAASKTVDCGDFVLLLAYSGLRKQEALNLKWSHVDFDSGVLRVGVDFQTKSGKERAVEFNDELERLLVSMRDKRAPDSAFLFPSIRTEGDGPAAREPKAWAIARQKTGLAIKPHDLRHFFTSFCVMSGIDWLSIAQWTGHADASLIAKTYAHLRPEYRQQAARRIRFQPVALERAAS